MDHVEAVRQMAVERYLLDELAPDARDAFEEHLFDCQECALDLRAGVAFVDTAKTQLTPMTEPSPVLAPVPARPARVKPGTQWDSWLAWWRPAFAVPAFASLLLVLGYQNLVTLPYLRAAANQPRLVATAPEFEATRGGSHEAVAADSKHGVVLPLEFPQQPGISSPQSFAVELFDPQSRLAWSGKVNFPAQSEDGERRLSLEIPGAMLRNGTFTVAVGSIDPNGQHTAIAKYAFDLHLTD